MKNILVATEIPFWQRSKGNHQRIFELLGFLANSFPVTVFYLGTEPCAKIDFPCKIIQCNPHQGLMSLIHKFFNIIPDKLRFNIMRQLNLLAFTRTLENFYSAKALTQFKKIYNAKRYDALIIEYVWYGYLLDAIDQTKTVSFLDIHDLYHKRKDRYAAYGRTPDRSISQEQELAVFSRFDYLIAIQQQEYEYLDKIFPGKIILAMHPHKVSRSMYSKRHENRLNNKLNIVYFASFGDQNLDAIHWFVNEVWDDSLLEKFTVLIYGTICDSLSIAKKGIEIKGRVSSPSDAYKQADIVINPIRFGSGLKIKTVEAIAHGIPTVASRIGAEGLEDTFGLSLLLADTPADYKKSLHILTQPEKRLEISKNSIQFAEQKLSHSACFGNFMEVIETVTKSNLV